MYDEKRTKEYSMNEVKVSLRKQIFLSLIPFYGFILIYFIGYYNIKKLGRRLTASVVHFIAVISFFTMGLLYSVVHQVYIVKIYPLPLLVIVAVIAFYIAIVCATLIVIWFEKIIINKILSSESNKQL